MKSTRPPGNLQLLCVLITTALVSFAAVADERRPEETIHIAVDPDLHRPGLARAVPTGSIWVEEYAPADTSLVLSLPTHIFFGERFEIISEVVNDRLAIRELGSPTQWAISPLEVDGPHAVIFHDTRYYSVDTDNHRVITFTNPEEEEALSRYTIAGIELNRPHDIVVDPSSGFLYVINPNQPTLLRMTGFGEQEGALDLSAVAGGYSRGLTVIDGTVYVAASRTGQVIEIVDFDSGEIIVHPSFGKLASANAGSWDTTGFVINDVELYDGYWYLSNFFSPYYANGTDHNLFKLVRFRTWEDLAIGNWEDLSHLVGDGQVPYFFTLHGGSLYLAAFLGIGVQDAIYKITSGLFFDDFESGDLGSWD